MRSYIHRFDFCGLPTTYLGVVSFAYLALTLLGGGASVTHPSKCLILVNTEASYPFRGSYNSGNLRTLTRLGSIALRRFRISRNVKFYLMRMGVTCTGGPFSSGIRECFAQLKSIYFAGDEAAF